MSFSYKRILASILLVGLCFQMFSRSVVIAQDVIAPENGVVSDEQMFHKNIEVQQNESGALLENTHQDVTSENTQTGETYITGGIIPITDESSGLVNTHSRTLDVREGEISRENTTTETLVLSHPRIIEEGSILTGSISNRESSGSIENHLSSSGIADSYTGNISGENNMRDSSILMERMKKKIENADTSSVSDERVNINKKVSELIVGIRKGSTMNTLQTYQDVENIHSLDNNRAVIEIGHEDSLENILGELKNDPNILYAQYNHVYTPQSSTPNDTEYPNQWYLNNIGQMVNNQTGTTRSDIHYVEAMDMLSGTSMGNQIIVAVLDNGIDYDHPEIRDQLWDGSHCVSYTGGALGGCFHGYDFYGNDTDPFNDYDNRGGSHGTFVAGIIGSTTNNRSGVAGIAPNIKIMPIRVCGPMGCFSSDIIKGIEFAKRNGATVINASFGRIESPKSIDDIDIAYRDAIAGFPGLFIAAAGNDGLNIDMNQYYFPSAYGQALTLTGVIDSGTGRIYTGTVTLPALNNIISVAATDSSDHITSFSNYGSGSVDIAAPGKDILGIVGSTGLVETGTISLANGWVRETNTEGLWYELTTASGDTVLFTDIHSGGYLNNTDVRLTKNYNFQNYTKKSITYSVWCNTATSTGFTDYITVETNTGFGWEEQDIIDQDILKLYGGENIEIYGHTGRLQSRVLNVEGIGNIQMAFRWRTDSITQTENGSPYLGCIIFGTTSELTRDRGVTGTYMYKDGTSFSSPMVAGAIALGAMTHPELSYATIKNILLGTGDPIDNSHPTRTNKRVNLANMLAAMKSLIFDTISSSFTSSNTASIHVGFNNTASGYILYGSSIHDIEQGIGEKHYFSGASDYSMYLSGLTEQTTYYYQVYGERPYLSGVTSSILRFLTPTVIPYDSPLNITSSGAVYLSGATSTGIVYHDFASGSLTLTDSGSNISFVMPFSGNTYTPNTPTNWNGIIGSIVQDTSTNIVTLDNGQKITIQGIYFPESGSGTFSNSGILNASLAGASGASVSIYKMNPNGTYSILRQCVVIGNICSIAIQGFENIAIGIPQFPSVSSNVGPGGGAGGGIPLFINSADSVPLYSAPNENSLIAPVFTPYNDRDSLVVALTNKRDENVLLQDLLANISASSSNTERLKKFQLYSLALRKFVREKNSSDAIYRKNISRLIPKMIRGYMVNLRTTR